MELVLTSYYAVLISTLFWYVLYQSLCLILLTKSPEYTCRIITGIHGVFAGLTGINQCLLNENPFEHPDWITTNLQKFILLLSLGYFIFDLIWCSYYKTETGLMILHHIYTIYTLKFMLWKEVNGAGACCALGCMEITNPYLQLRWFIRSEGYHKTILFHIVELLFFSLFFIFRICFGTYIVTTVLVQPKAGIEYQTSVVVIYVISWLFMIQMLKVFVSKYGYRGTFWEKTPKDIIVLE